MTPVIPTYDVVMCVAPQHIIIASKAIKSIKYFSHARKIFILTASECFASLQNNLTFDSSIVLLDENEIIENIDLNFIKNTMAERFSNQRPGWYFQQFLKMAMCNFPNIADHYLIWDSDTIMLSQLDFFSKDNKILVNPKTENHEPYFKLMKNAINLEKQVNFSFISEYFMIRKSYMKELITVLKNNANDNATWVEFILNSIDKKGLSCPGFSEFETYGNFISYHHKSSYICKPIKSMRRGTISHGKNPNKYSIFWLIKCGYRYVTFETWHTERKRKMGIKKNLVFKFFYVFNNLVKISTKQLKAANYIAD